VATASDGGNAIAFSIASVLRSANAFGLNLRQRHRHRIALQQFHAELNLGVVEEENDR
jgi:hypothetical protein